jgi:hypothetical protein
MPGDATQWPRKPWFTWAALAISLIAFGWFAQIQKRHMPTVEREDLAAYVRVSLPVLRLYPVYTVLATPKGQWAVPSSSGILYRTKIRPDHEELRTFLADSVYGRPLWRVFLWPLIGFLIVLSVLARFGQRMDRSNRGERLIQGAPIVSHRRWNRPLWFRKSQRGFYIDTE